MAGDKSEKPCESGWKNLAPGIVRKRVIIEGTTKAIVKPPEMKSYLLRLAEVVGTEVLSGPYAYPAHEMGFGGWIHWKSSGAHIYSYPAKPPLFTVDIYTCKPFSAASAFRFTKRFFSAIQMVQKEIYV